MALQLTRAVTVFLLSLALGASEVASALTMTTSIKNSELEVRWANESSSTLLLNMGSIMGEHPLYALRLSVEGISKESRSLAVGGASGAIEGRIDPWVILLPPRSEYIQRFPLHSLLLRDGRNLESLKLKQWRLTTSFTGRDAYDKAPGGRKIKYSITQNGETAIPFWKGTLNAQTQRSAP